MRPSGYRRHLYYFHIRPGGRVSNVDTKGGERVAIAYEDFVEKFKPKKTTDDCYTPSLVYDAVRDWACEKYGIDPASIVRPFYPGGDYIRFAYPAACFYPVLSPPRKPPPRKPPRLGGRCRRGSRR